MNHDQYVVILVNSTSHALKAEKVLEKARITCKLIPVPRQFSSECGSCVRIRQADQTRTIQELTAANLEIAGIYDL